MVGMTGVVELERRVADQSVVLFLGNVDVGKTTLVRRLHERVGGEVVEIPVEHTGLKPRQERVLARESEYPARRSAHLDFTEVVSRVVALMIV